MNCVDWREKPHLLVLLRGPCRTWLARERGRWGGAEEGEEQRHMCSRRFGLTRRRWIRLYISESFYTSVDRARMWEPSSVQPSLSLSSESGRVAPSTHPRFPPSGCELVVDESLPPVLYKASAAVLQSAGSKRRQRGAGTGGQGAAVR